jgi:hypothetical protein
MWGLLGDERLPTQASDGASHMSSLLDSPMFLCVNRRSRTCRRWVARKKYPDGCAIVSIKQMKSAASHLWANSGVETSKGGSLVNHSGPGFSLALFGQY